MTIKTQFTLNLKVNSNVSFTSLPVVSCLAAIIETAASGESDKTKLLSLNV